MHEQNMSHTNVCASQVVFDRKGKTKLSAGFSHILRYKQETQSTLNQHHTLVQMLSESLDNYKSRQSLIKYKFTQQQIDGGPATGIMQQSFANNFSADVGLKELKKNDLFDLGVMLTHAALGGLDLIGEEFVSKVPGLQSQCCLFHAVKNVMMT